MASGPRATAGFNMPPAWYRSAGFGAITMPKRRIRAGYHAVVTTASPSFVPTPCDRLHVAPSLTRRALWRDIVSSAIRGAHPSPTLPRSVVLPSIVLARLWLVTAQIMDFAAHRPDYARFFVVSESRATCRACRCVGRRDGRRHCTASRRSASSAAVRVRRQIWSN